MTLFTLGLGVGIWDKVETINVVFYAGALLLLLGGLSWFGFEALMGFHAYRPNDQQTVRTGQQPFDLLRLSAYVAQARTTGCRYGNTLEAAESLFYQVESNGHPHQEAI